MAKITEADVYNTLSYHVWKRPREILEEIIKDKGIKDPTEPRIPRSNFRIWLIVLFKWALY